MVVKKKIKVVEEQAPPAEEEPPTADEEAPPAEEEPPTADEEPTPAEEEATPADEEPPTAEEEAPPAEEEPPTAKEEPPAAEQATTKCTVYYDETVKPYVVKVPMMGYFKKEEPLVYDPANPDEENFLFRTRFTNLLVGLNVIRKEEGFEQHPDVTVLMFEPEKLLVYLMDTALHCTPEGLVHRRVMLMLPYFIDGFSLNVTGIDVPMSMAYKRFLQNAAQYGVVCSGDPAKDITAVNNAILRKGENLGDACYVQVRVMKKLFDSHSSMEAYHDMTEWLLRLAGINRDDEVLEKIATLPGSVADILRHHVLAVRALHRMREPMPVCKRMVEAYLVHNQVPKIRQYAQELDIRLPEGSLEQMCRNIMDQRPKFKAIHHLNSNYLTASYLWKRCWSVMNLIEPGHYYPNSF